MTSISTPNNLEVLIHCHCSPQIHSRADAPAVKEAFSTLLNEGLIERDDRHYTTTEKGKFYLAHLLSVPFPIQEFRIPEVME